LDTYYVELSAQSIHHPEIEDNPARARWNLVRRRIRDGSFFIYAQDLTLESTFHDRFQEESETTSPRSIAVPRARARESISFERIISQANEMVAQRIPVIELNPVAAVPRRLADAHSVRASDPGNRSATSSYEKHLDRKAAQRVSTFISGNLKAIRRLSRMDISSTALDHALGSLRDLPRQTLSVEPPHPRSVYSPPNERASSRPPSRMVREPSQEYLHIRRAPSRSDMSIAGRDPSQERVRRSGSEPENVLYNRRLGSVNGHSRSNSSGSGRISALPGSPRPAYRRGPGSVNSDQGDVVARALESLRMR
jgi:hypothetical protein